MVLTLRTLVSLVFLVTGLGGEATTGQDTVSERAQTLIEQLGSQQYLVRLHAEQELARLGFDAFDALSAATSHDDLEIATRARYLLQRVRVPWVEREDPVEVQKLMRDYDQLSRPERLARIDRLAELRDDKGLLGLCRIARYDPTPAISKMAAIALLKNQADDELWQRRARVIGGQLKTSHRPASRWLSIRIATATDPQAAVRRWTKAIEQERNLLDALDEDSHAKILVGLMRQKVMVLKQLDRSEEALALMVEMLDLQDGQMQSLLALVNWLVEEQAWKLVERVAQQFSGQFHTNPLLLYAQAEARIRLDPKAAVSDLVARVDELNGKDSGKHLRLAMTLQDQGLLRWAEAEYRHTMRLGDQNRARSVGWSVFAARRLSEMLHDQGKERMAAETLDEMFQVIDRSPVSRKAAEGFLTDLDSVRSRRDYFYAQHFASQGDHQKQRAYLDQAIRHDPNDVDVLIALYRYPQATAADREQTRKRIRTVTESFRRQIRAEPNDPSGYNQLAWLVANTEGDLDEATRFSHRSLELQPDAAGYLDTLAHCYYAQKDYASAVKYQARAAKLDPHSQLIAKQYRVFQAALQKSQPDAATGDEPVGP